MRYSLHRDESYMVIYDVVVVVSRWWLVKSIVLFLTDSPIDCSYDSGVRRPIHRTLRLSYDRLVPCTISPTRCKYFTLYMRTSMHWSYHSFVLRSTAPTPHVTYRFGPRLTHGLLVLRIIGPMTQ